MNWGVWQFVYISLQWSNGYFDRYFWKRLYAIMNRTLAGVHFAHCPAPSRPQIPSALPPDGTPDHAGYLVVNNRVDAGSKCLPSSQCGVNTNRGKVSVNTAVSLAPLAYWHTLNEVLKIPSLKFQSKKFYFFHNTAINLKLIVCPMIWI